MGATMNKLDVRAVRFFRDNAGYIVGERLKGAAALARAEQYARTLGWEVAWEPEDIPYEDCLGDHAYWCADERRGKKHAHEVYYAVLRDASGEVRASLGGIIDPDRNFARVIEAELALEAMPGNVP